MPHRFQEPVNVREPCDVAQMCECFVEIGVTSADFLDDPANTRCGTSLTPEMHLEGRSVKFDEPNQAVRNQDSQAPEIEDVLNL
jgi:hypothetical protein